jgi:ABC-type dipeptide/oligopeptide/nickel transport system permease subunit
MSSSESTTEKTISGIDVMRGVGVERARPFWADAWHRVVIRRGAQLGLVWIGIIGFFAIFAPVIANGLPLWTIELSDDGTAVNGYSPLFQSLTPTDILLLLGGILGTIFFFVPFSMGKQHRLGLISAAALLSGTIVVAIATLRYLLVGDEVTALSQSFGFKWFLSFGTSGVVALLLFWLPTFRPIWGRVVFTLAICLFTGYVSADRWTAPVLNPERFIRGQDEGNFKNTYTLVPWSPTQSRPVFYSRRPARTAANAYELVAENRVKDGVAFYARALVFNLKSLEGSLPLTKETRASLVSMLANGSDMSDSKGDSVLAQLGVAGFSAGNLEVFEQLADDLKAYTSWIKAQELDQAVAAAKNVVLIASQLTPSGRNGRITITDAGDELIKKTAERITYVSQADSVASTSYGQRDFILGTDPIGRDVLSQMLHACRLSISIGLVSTGLSVLIGVIVGSLMGYFGGWVDLVLSRIVEIFMAVPVLFLLIVAASVLPRNTYVMMVIIGCVTWTGSARFIRAEFLKLRNQDFVQSCRAVGLPLHSTLFRHMLPNGVTPVLVQASFGVAAAIIAEATLSYLGLGPYGQSSWGKLLSLTTGETGVFLWWMAVFPGAAIFLTVLAYNVLGENFRDAIDPKMRKAAH